MSTDSPPGQDGTSGPLFEESELERALRLAANEPACRPDFYKQLLAANIFILGHAEADFEGAKTMDVGEKVAIQKWPRSDGTPVIPFFTSLNTLRQAIRAQSDYMALSARSFFEMTKGSTLVLNPNSTYGKEFFPAEIEALLSVGMNTVAEQRVTKHPTKVLLGQPKNYPTSLVESLKKLLTMRPAAKAAYLVQMHDPTRDEKPHLLIGIAGEGDLESLIREVGAVAGDASPAGEPVDLVRVVPGDKGLSEYFLRETRPFYERRKTGLIQRLFRTFGK